MISISCAYTPAAVEARTKTRTRRFWKPKYAAMVRRHTGDLVEILTAQRRFGGKHICHVRLLGVSENPEPLDTMTEDDFQLEGFQYIGKAVEAGILDVAAITGLARGVDGRLSIIASCTSVAAGGEGRRAARCIFDNWRMSRKSAFVVNWEYLPVDQDIYTGDEVMVLPKGGPTDPVAFIGEVLCVIYPCESEPQAWVLPKTMNPDVNKDLGDPGKNKTWTWHGPLSCIRVLLKARPNERPH